MVILLTRMDYSHFCLVCMATVFTRLTRTHLLAQPFPLVFPKNQGSNFWLRGADHCFESQDGKGREFTEHSVFAQVSEPHCQSSGWSGSSPCPSTAHLCTWVTAAAALHFLSCELSQFCRYYLEFKKQFYRFWHTQFRINQITLI